MYLIGTLVGQGQFFYEIFYQPHLPQKSTREETAIHCCILDPFANAEDETKAILATEAFNVAFPELAGITNANLLKSRMVS